MRIILTFFLVSFLAIPVMAGKDKNAIELSGFDCADKNTHMIEWLGRDDHYRDFVVADVKAELSNQQPGSQLLKLECTGEPEFLTTVLAQDGNDTKAILTKFSVTFPLKATVNLSGSVWELTIDQNYVAQNLNVPSELKVTQNFTVKGSAKK